MLAEWVADGGQQCAVEATGRGVFSCTGPLWPEGCARVGIGG